jgi:hypothetical protein
MYPGSFDSQLFSAQGSGLDVRARSRVMAEREHAVEENAGASAAKRLGAIGLAYRAWGTAQPHRYRLAIQTRLGSGELAPERVIPAAHRGMAVIVDAIGRLPDARKPKVEPPADLRSGHRRGVTTQARTYRRHGFARSHKCRVSAGCSP